MSNNEGEEDKFSSDDEAEDVFMSNVDSDIESNKEDVAAESKEPGYENAKPTIPITDHTNTVVPTATKPQFVNNVGVSLQSNSDSTDVTNQGINLQYSHGAERQESFNSQEDSPGTAQTGNYHAQ